MGPELVEMEAKSNTLMEISPAKQNNGSVPESPSSKLMHCGNNFDDNPTHNEVLSDGRANLRSGIEDDVTECTKSGDHVLVEAECQDTTENSSSFSGTISGTENSSTLSDIEVESPFCGGNVFASMVDGYSRALPMRKKKLTEHWRRFIRPIMWRCKWIELQIKEMKSQALKYDTKLAQYDQRKEVELENSMLEGFDESSQSFSSHNIRGNQVMKRKKRKRVEEKTDVASYMSQHNLFSYYEYKRSIANCALLENDYGNRDNKTVNGTDGLEFNDVWLSLEFGDCGNSLEQMLSKIEVAQSQVRKLKDRIDKVLTENPGKYTSINRLSLLMPCNGSTSSDQNMASPSENGDGMPDRSQCISPPHISEGNMGNLFMPENAVSSHGDVIPLPDILESTGHYQVGDLCETNKEAIPIDIEPSDEELQNFERVISQFTSRHHESLEKLNTSPPAVTPESALPSKMPKLQGQPSTSKSNLHNNRRKWGRQKSLLSKRNRKSSG